MNYFAILACGIAAMAVGFIWYGPLFGKLQRRLMGEETMTAEQKESMTKAMGAMFLLQFIMALLTATVLEFLVTRPIGGVSTMEAALAIWLGFIVTTTGGNVLWSGKPKKAAWQLFFLSNGGQLVTFMLFGIILSIWK